MVLRTPLILISGGFSQLPSGDVVPGLDATAQASGNAALVVANSALASGTAAQASGNAALVSAASALASVSTFQTLTNTAVSLASGASTDFTVNAGNFYTCTTNTTGVFNPLHWLLIAPQYTIYYAQYPYPPFEYSKFYNVGDNVFWKNSIYKTKIATQVINHNAALQYGKIEDLPLINIAPDDPNTGDEYWQFISNYNIPANTNINNTTYWTKGDNRDPQMVLYLTDIVLYHLHTRIAPRNIPEIRVKRYDNAIDWLKMCAEGDVTPNLPLLQPKQGNRIRYGGNIKLINI